MKVGHHVVKVSSRGRSGLGLFVIGEPGSKALVPVGVLISPNRHKHFRGEVVMGCRVPSSCSKITPLWYQNDGLPNP